MTQFPFLVHHDRPEHLDGVRLAVASIRRYCADAEILVSVPETELGLRDWLRAQGCRELQLETTAAGWNAKPSLILQALAEGRDAVLWMDSDVILSADPRESLLDELDVFVATEEPATYQHQGSRERTLGWGLAVGRELPITVNSSVVRAGAEHVGLLEQWRSLLSRPDYVSAQMKPWYERPVHMVGDQDALTALLGSADFAGVKMRQLTRGVDIAHCDGPAGFSVIERLRSLRTGMPPFVHSMSVKPWQHGAPWRFQGDRKRRIRSTYEDMRLRLSPYTILARQLADSAGVSGSAFDSGHRWRQSFGDRWPQLPELPLAIFDSCVRSAMRVASTRPTAPA